MLFKLPFILIIAYILISFLQLVASIDGIMHFFGLHWIFAGFAALLMFFIPAIGPLAGVYGAVAVWNWPPVLAVLLFFWPYLLYAALFLFGATGSVFLWRRFFWPFSVNPRSPSSRPQDIEPEFSVKEKNDADPEGTAHYIEYKQGK